jgi:hypothetical protein
LANYQKLGHFRSICITTYQILRLLPLCKQGPSGNYSRRINSRTIWIDGLKHIILSATFKHGG